MVGWWCGGVVGGGRRWRHCLGQIRKTCMSLCPQASSHKVCFVRLMRYFVGIGSGSQPGDSRPLTISMVFPWYELTFAELFRSRNGIFFRAEVQQCARQLFDGIGLLHNVGIVHGDLSFPNLLMRVSPSGSQPVCNFNLVIADFGSASYMPVCAYPSCPEEYQAPELVLGVPAGELTEAIDIWAAGVFVASACTGRMFPRCPLCIHVLGPLTEDVWPGCSAMPAFSDLGFERLAARCATDCSLTKWFARGDGSQPVDPVVDMTENMLAWAPDQRKPMVELVEHPFFWDDPAEAEARESLRRLPRDILEDLVMQCHRGGITLRDLLTLQDDWQAEPASEREMKREPASELEVKWEAAQEREPAMEHGAAQEREFAQEIVSAHSQAAQESAQLVSRAEQSAQERVSARSQAASVDSAADLTEQLGPCAGNCGRLSCKFAQNRGLEPICEDCQTTRHPSGRCDMCRCESITCMGRARHGARFRAYDGRWCSSCWSKVKGIPSSQYANAHGVHTFGNRWGTTLRLTARFGFACVRMMPMDVGAVFRFDEHVFGPHGIMRLWPWKGSGSQPDIGFSVATVIVASAIKWPYAIAAFVTALKMTTESSDAKRIEPSVGLAICIMIAAEACDGMEMEAMHGELSRTGRAGSLTGLIWLLRRLRFVETSRGNCREEDDEDGSQPAVARSLKRRRSTAGSRPAGSQPDPVVRARRSRSVEEVALGVIARMGESDMQSELELGKLQTSYKVKCGKVAVESCRRLTGRPVGHLRLPASASTRQVEIEVGREAKKGRGR